ncbi:MAG: hypothetical protein ACJA13_003267, partial [Paraglaciecola sp.]
TPSANSDDADTELSYGLTDRQKTIRYRNHNPSPISNK